MKCIFNYGMIVVFRTCADLFINLFITVIVEKALIFIVRVSRIARV